MNDLFKNRTYLTITLLLIFWLLIAAAGHLFAPYEFDYSENIITTFTDRGRVLVYSPHEPSARHLLGTDVYGYDLLTSLLYGARYTIFTTLISASMRTFLGFILGYAQARRGTGEHRFSVFIGMPVFIVVYFLVFGFIFNPSSPPIIIAAVQTMLFIAFGLPSTIPVFREKTAVILSAPFIEAAISCGGDQRWVFTHHILNHMREDVTITFTQEIVSVLTLIGQLGIFSIFIGGTRLTTHPLELTSITREWGGLIGQNLAKISTPYWWIILFPLCGYLLLYLSAHAAATLMERHAASTYRKTSNL